jgi:SAM-dependent methyltransferase
VSVALPRGPGGAEVAAARSTAYDRHYRALWHARTFTREVIEEAIADALQVPHGGDASGNELQAAMAALGVPHLAGRTILDYCCGTGMTAIYFAMLGATVHAFDRSPVAIGIARESAERSGVSGRVAFSVADAQRLPYPDATFDAAFCRSALHIVVDYEDCPAELARVLRPGGTAVFCEEALGYNPVFEAIRFVLRRKYRECGGRPLRYPDIDRFGRPFSTRRVRHFNVLSQARTLLYGGLDGPRLRRLLAALDRADRFLLERLPALRRLSGKVVVEYVR